MTEEEQQLEYKNKFDASIKKAHEIYDNADRMTEELISENKNINLELLAESLGELRKRSGKGRLFVDVTRMNFICNRIDGLDKNVQTIVENDKIKVESDNEVHKNIFESLKIIEKKLDGYPLIRTAVVSGISTICLSVLGVVGYIILEVIKKLI